MIGIIDWIHTWISEPVYVLYIAHVATSHVRGVPSVPVDRIYLPLLEKETLLGVSEAGSFPGSMTYPFTRLPPWAFESVFTHFPVTVSQILIDPSELLEAYILPSGDQRTVVTLPSCAWSSDVKHLNVLTSYSRIMLCDVPAAKKVPEGWKSTVRIGRVSW